MARRPRVLLADDHALVIAGLRKLLEPDFEVVASVEDGRALVARALELLPDVVLLDISMPLLNGLEAARQIRKAAPAVKLVFVTMHTDAGYISGAFAAGASGYLLKQSAATELAAAIRAVLGGATYLTPLIDPRRVADLGFGSELTARQREVLQLIAEGKSTKEIAALVHISVKTVEFHKYAITRKLGLRTVAELTRYAIAHRIMPT